MTRGFAFLVGIDAAVGVAIAIAVLRARRARNPPESAAPQPPPAGPRADEHK